MTRDWKWDLHVDHKHNEHKHLTKKYNFKHFLQIRYLKIIYIFFFFFTLRSSILWCGLSEIYPAK